MKKEIFAFPFFWILLIASLGAEEKVIPQSREILNFSFAPLVKKVAPAVVSIYASHVIKVKNPLLEDPFLNQFFGMELFGDAPTTRLEKSLGSGVIVRENGIIITNYHVIKDAQEIRVILSDGREFIADVISKEERTDLASIKIRNPPQSLPIIQLADMDEMEVGDLVLAIGSPFGLEQTVTNGIISALARTQLGISDFRSFIQTDAAINPGNSGGALVTMDGRLAGINSAILSKSGGFIGIGFAIPSSLLVPVIESYKHDGKIIRPWIGADVKNVTLKEAESYGLDRSIGTLITGVYPGSPADKAGLKPGDLIYAFDGREIKNSAAYRFRTASRPVGHIAELVIINKEGKKEDFQVDMQAPPEAEDARHITLQGRNPFAGATVANLSPSLAAQWGIDFLQKGVLILKIQPDSIAHHIGLAPGDIITELNGAEIDNFVELQKALAQTRSLRQHQAAGWKFSVKRGGHTYNLTIQ